MNKNRHFTANMKKVVQQIDRFYEGAAFGAIHFSGAGQGVPLEAALGILEEAQGRCMDYLMHTDEVRQACDYLGGQSEKARPLVERFWKSLAENDQNVRFEATAQTLRVIRQQFGSQ